ncbi:23S rRNA pseudouridine(2604) synthase RluF [Candidatus Galacturonibacter soehngenii]|uniref:Pseudouridine synthase n=1 Tax=Candidatus Galacturonatibacter soehngenii TaxID=2307010 RepID=A0A7V7QNJ3_9FIRM|nr:23S rRNA pseudouridine(2604) synthase RluF [Candidatus Galacturonibacter soehngenii]KAB1440606.1 23S rRNA pseudouridine(2604) synthase RluF [Candidatus Galacturonibacter soehngenii]MBA4687865.1 23S rRNA pseudouridine(2604) synthase RluF [Candidatus Galacturonibacter soehngenii]
MSSKIKREFEKKPIEPIRINKYLSEAGVCSRREADRLIEAGKITVDGVLAVMGTKVDGTQRICVEGKEVLHNEKMVLLAFNKPIGIVCTTQKKEKNNIVDYIQYPQRIYPVGRLDKDSQGLILMTNNGDIVNKMMRAHNMHEKEYLVWVDKPITEEFLHGMAKGVPILDTVTRECKITKTGTKSFRIIITQGLNRQIRRMCEYFDYKVTKLERIRIMNIKLGKLAQGKYRDITQEELKELEKLIQKSSNITSYGEKNGRK